MADGIDRVGRTAFVIAGWRRDESEQPAPLVWDPLADLFLEGGAEELSDRLERTSPGTRVLIHYRTRCFDEQLRAAMEQGVGQVLLLGAGLDTRALRLLPQEVAVFEVDRPEVLAFKRERLEAGGYFPPGVGVGADYTAVDLVAELVAHGFDPQRETFILWEGNTMYLEEEQVVGVLSALRDGVNSFTLTFDYLSRALIEGRTEQRDAHQLVAGFGDSGASWKGGFDNISELAQQVGLRVESNALVTDWMRTHAPGQILDSDLFRDYFICTLRSGA